MAGIGGLDSGSNRNPDITEMQYSGESGIASVFCIILCGRFSLYFNLVPVSGYFYEEPVLYKMPDLQLGHDYAAIACFVYSGLFFL